MNFRAKLLAYSIAASIASMAPTLSVADDLNLSYKEFAIKSPEAEKYWSDELPNVAQYGELVPTVEVAETKINGENFTISMISSMYHCGMNTCPVRVFRDDNFVMEVTACSNTDFHKITRDGKFFIACDNLMPIGQ